MKEQFEGLPLDTGAWQFKETMHEEVARNSMKKENSSSRLPELGQSSSSTSSSSRKNRNKVVDLAQGFVGSKMFDWIITGIIILQAIALAVEATPLINPAGENYQLLEVETFSLIQSLVIAVFMVEAILRMIALYPRPQNYFRDPWNCSILQSLFYPLRLQASFQQ